MSEGFRSMLVTRQKKINSLVCVGIDPVLEKFPGCIDTTSFADIIGWAREIIDATAPFASMFKPNIAFYEAMTGGINVLSFIIKYIHEKYPGIPVLVDSKRGDIGNTQKRYMEAIIGILKADGMNFSPYMGKDCMEALVDLEKYPGKAIVGLCYTSNPAARQVQDVKLQDGRLYWEFMAEFVLTGGCL